MILAPGKQRAIPIKGSEFRGLRETNHPMAKRLRFFGAAPYLAHHKGAIISPKSGDAVDDEEWWVRERRSSFQRRPMRCKSRNQTC
jgi:hypothetical protein